MDDTDKFQPKRRWHFRFSISMLLVLMAMVAGYFSGYRLGWIESAKDEQANRVVRMYYNVTNLIRPVDADSEWAPAEKDFVELVRLIEALTPLEHRKSTGKRDETIRLFVEKEALIVAGKRKTHKDLRDLLDDLQNDYTGMYVPQSGPWVKAP